MRFDVAFGAAAGARLCRALERWRCLSNLNLRAYNAGVDHAANPRNSNSCPFRGADPSFGIIKWYHTAQTSQGMLLELTARGFFEPNVFDGVAERNGLNVRGF